MVEQIASATEAATAQRNAVSPTANPDGSRNTNRADLDPETQRANGELKRRLMDELAGEPVQQPHELRLRVEEDIDLLVGEVVNRETNEVVREIPPEEIVTTAKRLNAILGYFLDRQV